MKVILAMIYMRTLLALAEEDSTPTMRAIMGKCASFERLIFKKNKALYLQCTDIAREVWTLTKSGKDQYGIEIEPTVAGLYYSVQAEMKKMKFKPTLIDRLYDKYFHTSSCDLEAKSRALADEIWCNTNAIMKQRIMGAA